MKTKEYTYADHAYSSIWHFKTKCSQVEYESLKKEVSQFCMANKDLPIAEQKKLFDEKYGHIAGSVGNRNILAELRSVNRKLSFFVILAIVSIIIAFFAAVGSTMNL